jgi:hypothetical protein
MDIFSFMLPRILLSYFLNAEGNPPKMFPHHKKFFFPLNLILFPDYLIFSASLQHFSLNPHIKAISYTCIAFQ